nr:hypothetical protein [Catenibacterium mitsuokai]
MKKLNNMDLIVEMGNVNNKKRNYGIANTNKNKKRSVDSNKRNDIVEMSNNKSKKRNNNTVNTNKNKKRSIGSNKRNKNKKFTLEYYVEKCVEVAATKGFKIKGERMWAIGMFEINEAKYLLTVDKYGLLFWFVDLATLVIAVTRYLNKSQDDNYDLNRHYIPICDVWLMLLRCY